VHSNSGKRYGDDVLAGDWRRPRKGAIAEMGPTGRVFDNPLHPYSRHLLSCVPQLHRTWAEVDAELAADPPEDVVLPIAEDDHSAPLVEAEEGHFVGIDQA